VPKEKQDSPPPAIGPQVLVRQLTRDQVRRIIATAGKAAELIDVEPYPGGGILVRSYCEPDCVAVLQRIAHEDGEAQLAAQAGEG
jgi:hypothetical protein